MGNQISEHVDQAQKTGILQLRGFKLYKIPPEVFTVTQFLRNLDLSNNRLNIITSNLFINAKILKNLNLSNNRIESISTEIGYCLKLESLDLSHNILTCLPKGIEQLKNLKKINLSNNQLDTIPSELGHLAQLDFIDLSQNKIEKIDDNVQNLNCIELNLNENRIRFISDKIAKCSRLKVTRLEKNALEAKAIPVSLLKDSQVSLINFEGNLFSKKEFEQIEGYEKYMERYTATRRKFD
ncbi:unnamed protein product [Brachionus calyciflorus]|uniref:Leucine-rich repeat-containing protein 57 n=1 Tax=Brachionus calyciflorus TaxID=104777 RepID=A0A814JQ96_9BILA|nr:unnamed protein product [Brachionus calyciflorus]